MAEEEARPTHNENFVLNTLQETIDRLNSRRERLEPFLREAKDIERVLPRLEKLLPGPSHGGPGAQSGNRGGAQVNGSGSELSRERKRELVLDALKDQESGLPGSRIAERVDFDGRAVYHVCEGLRKDGELARTERGWWILPSFEKAKA